MVSIIHWNATGAKCTVHYVDVVQIFQNDEGCLLSAKFVGSYLPVAPV